MKVHIVRVQPPWRPDAPPRPWCGTKLRVERGMFATRPLLVDGDELPDPLPFGTNNVDSLCTTCRQAEEMWRQGRRSAPLLTSLHFAENVKGGRAHVERELAALWQVAQNHIEEFAELVEGEQVLAALAGVSR